MLVDSFCFSRCFGDNPNWPEGHCRPCNIILRIQKWEEGRAGEHWEWCHLSSQVVMGPCSPGDDWTVTCPLDTVVNSLICFACLHSFCFRYKTAFLSTREFSDFYPSSSLPYPAGVGVRKCLHGLVCLLGLTMIQALTLSSTNVDYYRQWLKTGKQSWPSKQDEFSHHTDHNAQFSSTSSLMT